MRELEGSVNENKTLCFNFTHHGQVRDGETLSNPQIFSDPDNQLIFGTPVVLIAPFRDSDGKKVEIGKGVKVRINGMNATPGTDYRVICRVDTSGGDTIEEDHTYHVKDSLP